MKLFKAILLQGILCVAFNASAQVPTPPKSNINKMDAEGKPHGTWMVAEDARMGEEAYIAFGNFEHGRKTGPWYKLTNDRQLLAMENYRDNLLDGEVKYYENGRMICLGHYRSIDASHGIDSIVVTNPVTGAETLQALPKDKSTMRHGIWRFYDAESGRLLREEDYQVDEMVFFREFPMSKEDSVYYSKRNEKLPHKKGGYYKPPAAKQTSYIK
jgi:antitoxin component YwqK of YwqJK toxin-antitoxin module